MERLRALNLTVLISVVSFLSACSFFSQRQPAPGLIQLCRAVPSYDLTSRLSEIRTIYIGNHDLERAQQIMLDIARDFSCHSKSTLYLSYAHVDDASLPGGISCLSMAILENWYTQPHFEEWSACDSPRDLRYLIDFNNIVTNNHELEDSLRFVSVATPGTKFRKNFFGRLEKRLVIHDYGEFLTEGVLFDIEANQESQFELGVALNI